MTTKTASEIVIYEGDNARVEVRLDRESVWLTQEQVGLLFGRERSVITKHIRNVFAEGELERAAVCANFAHTDSRASSPSANTLRMCLVITERSRSNKCPICSWVSQTVSLSMETDNCTSPSAAVKS